MISPLNAHTTQLQNQVTAQAASLLALGSIGREEARPERAQEAHSSAHGPGMAPPSTSGPTLLGCTSLSAIGSLGRTLRSNAMVSKRLRCIAAIAAARFWDCPFQLAVHSRLGRAAGVPREAIERVLAGFEPIFHDRADQLAWALAGDLLSTGTINPGRRSEATGILTDPEVAEIVAAVGFQSLVAMVQNNK